MNWSSFKYLARQGLHSMVKNRLMSVASIGVLTVCLLITGVAGLFTLNVGSLMDYLGSQNETVVYLKEDLTEEGLAAVDSALRSISGLREVTYVSKDEALERMKESMGESAYLFDVFEGSENPFYANYRVVLDDVSDLPEIMPQLEAIEGVESVGAPMQLSEMFTSVHQGVSLVCIVLVAVLGFVSVVVISNTIRLTVFARRKEINIMKYVGATNGFIRLPFFVEGVTVGLIAGVISTVLVLGAYQLLLIYAVDLPGFWGSLLGGTLMPLSKVWYLVLGGFLAFGMLIGSLGTASSIRKYLKV
ncbi:MAG TPA: permease-like cell division protein FtsX [Candidatus Fournierella merdipullorum]|uniref:Cell division protein FtsX n=1 Tax=Candidatus Allofournierella merdipullorum TaxID=2838595 RepID=A0A9D2E4R5_9FIRM|nr:permease-like cell division protein FtsX [Candidatus Fournierella merdipullorum]